MHGLFDVLDVDKNRRLPGCQLGLLLDVCDSHAPGHSWHSQTAQIEQTMQQFDYGAMRAESFADGRIDRCVCRLIG